MNSSDSGHPLSQAYAASVCADQRLQRCRTHMNSCCLRRCHTSGHSRRLPEFPSERADSTFHFRYDDLPLLEELIIKLDESSPFFKKDVKLEIVNRLNEVLITLEKDEFGMFVYKRMVASKYHTTTVEELDTTDIVINETKIHIENHIIYYPKNGSDINEAYFSTLDSMVVSLKENIDALIQVHGHASSTASENYNMKLSIKRKDKVVEYLVKNGIDRNRISSNAFGESQLVNMCEDDENCEEEMHKLNRRTELKILIKD